MTQETEKTFIHDGCALKYYEQGRGDPMLLLHGFGASSYSWRYLFQSFSETHRVLAMDLKGFGLSDKPTDDKYSVRDQSDIVADFIRKLGLDNLILGGNSFGGAVALLTCLQFMDSGPNPIRKMILIDSAGYKQRLPGFLTLLRTPLINQMGLTLVPGSVQARMILLKAFFGCTKITEEMVRTYGSYLDLPGAHQALIKTAQQIVPPDVDRIVRRYREIPVPVLIIWGEQDRIIPLSVGKKLKTEIPTSTLVTIPRCGHIPQEELPLETIRLISDFLQ